jgi:2-dehydropantoate 2-reductase
VVIGTLDPNDAIRGRGELRLRDAGIEVACFDPDLMAQLEGLNCELSRERAGCCERQAITRKMGASRTSMLQDTEAARPTELDAIVGAVVELARLTGTPASFTTGLMGLVRVFARTRGIYPAGA